MNKTRFVRKAIAAAALSACALAASSALATAPGNTVADGCEICLGGTVQENHCNTGRANPAVLILHENNNPGSPIHIIPGYRVFSNGTTAYAALTCLEGADAYRGSVSNGQTPRCADTSGQFAQASSCGTKQLCQTLLQ